MFVVAATAIPATTTIIIFGSYDPTYSNMFGPLYT
jgi:hypothetical protein